jgi:hypothetical protein
MQVTAKITEIVTISETDLAAIESFFLGIGAAAIAVVAFYGVYRWRTKSIDNRVHNKRI